MRTPIANENPVLKLDFFDANIVLNAEHLENEIDVSFELRIKCYPIYLAFEIFELTDHETGFLVLVFSVATV